MPVEDEKNPLEGVGSIMQRVEIGCVQFSEIGKVIH